PHPIVISSCACRASSGVNFVVVAAERSTPASRIAASTSGWTRGPGSVPAESARALPGSASRLNQAAAICERPALWTQAKSTVFTMRRPRSRRRLLLARRAARAAGGAVEHVELTERALELAAVLVGGRHLPQGVDGGADDAANQRGQRARHLVMHPHAVAAGFDEATPAQIGEMAGHGGLGQAEAVVHVADTDLVVAEQRQDAQACLVGQRLEHRFQVVDGGAAASGGRSLHIFALTNIPRRAYIRQSKYKTGASSWIQSRKRCSRSTARRRSRPRAARPHARAAPRAMAIRSRRTSTTRRRPRASRRKRSLPRSAAATRPRWRSSPPARSCSTSVRAAASTCSCRRGASARPARPTAWT